MEKLLKEWKKMLEAGEFGGKISVHGDGEEEKFVEFSAEFVRLLRSYTLNSSVSVKQKLLPYLEELYDSIKAGKLKDYLKELQPEPGFVYRGRTRFSVEDAKREGLFPVPDKLVPNTLYEFSGGIYQPRKNDITSWTYDTRIAAQFASETLPFGHEPTFNVIMVSSTEEPGFILNYMEIEQLYTMNEHEVLYIGGELKLKKVLAYYYEPPSGADALDLVDKLEKPEFWGLEW